MAARWASMVTVSKSHEVVGDNLQSSQCFKQDSLAQAGSS